MKIVFRILAMMTILLASANSIADSHSTDNDDLRKQLEALQNRVAALEATRPTFTSFMPNMAERFHVMHRAGEAGDWAVAAHELQELKRLTAISTYTDAKNGQLMQGMMGPSIESLDDAIEHGNSKKFQTALEQTVSTCNACHTATGSSFIQVTLDAQESISLRHPHTFAERGIPGGHTHDMPDQSQPMMEQMEGMMVEMHNDSDQPEHND